jgi:predicted nicotinamide N-methyase
VFLTGTTVWKASLALAALLEHRFETTGQVCAAADGLGEGRLLSGRRAQGGTVGVELGAGMGIAGLALARLDPRATVVLTDNQPPVNALLVRNAAANRVARQCPVADFSWGSGLRPIKASLAASLTQRAAAGSSRTPGDSIVGGSGCPHLDVVLGSDVVYGGSDAAWGPLLSSIQALVRALGSDKTIVLLAFGNRGRHTSDHLAFLARARTVFRTCTCLDLPPGLGKASRSCHSGGASPSNTEGGAAFYDGIDLFELSGLVGGFVAHPAPL